MNQNGEKGQVPLVFLHNNPHPMWIFDHKTLRFRDVNNAAILKYGYSRAEFLKMKITDIRPKEQIPKLLSGIRPFRLEAIHITERQHTTKNGQLIDVEITASQLHFRGRPAVLVEIQDITERKRTEETLRQLAIVKERNRIAREMHDTLAQAFTGILLQLEAAGDALARNPEKVKGHIARARGLARKGLTEARRSVLQIRPQHAPHKGLAWGVRSMADQARRLGVPINYSIEGRPRRISAEIENHLMRIAQEALTNTIRHSGATRVDLQLCFAAQTIKLFVHDNGKGFLSEFAAEGFGLISIQERANQIGAKVRIRSAPGNGCSVAVTVRT